MNRTQEFYDEVERKIIESCEAWIKSGKKLDVSIHYGNSNVACALETFKPKFGDRDNWSFKAEDHLGLNFEEAVNFAWGFDGAENKYNSSTMYDIGIRVAQRFNVVKAKNE